MISIVNNETLKMGSPKEFPKETASGNMTAIAPVGLVKNILKSKIISISKNRDMTSEYAGEIQPNNMLASQSAVPVCCTIFDRDNAEPMKINVSHSKFRKSRAKNNRSPGKDNMINTRIGGRMVGILVLLPNNQAAIIKIIKMNTICIFLLS